MIINTQNGEVNSDDCTFREGTIENDNEVITWQEYWLGEELVKRDAQITLKHGLFGDSFAG